MLTSAQQDRLTPDQKAEYYALSALFESEGWRYFEERLWNEYEASRSRKENAPNWEQNRVAHGEAQAYNAILTLPLSIDAEYAVEDMPESEDEI